MDGVTVAGCRAVTSGARSNRRSIRPRLHPVARRHARRDLLAVKVKVYAAKPGQSVHAGDADEIAIDLDHVGPDQSPHHPADVDVGEPDDFAHVLL